MSLRFIIIGLVASIAATLVVVSWRLTHPVVHNVSVVEAPRVESYLVTAHAMPAGTLLRNDDFTSKSVTYDKVPPGALLDTSESRTDIRGALVRRYLEGGAPILPGDITRPRDRGFLAAVLAPGTRAVSVGVTAISGVAGLIWPGDHVDVLLVQDLPTSPEHPDRTVSAETIMANVRVLAVDQDIAQGPPSNGTSAGHNVATVTLQTTVDQAERLAVAEHLGHLSLAVRASETMQTINDIAGVAVSGSDVSQALSRASGPPNTRVEVIQGASRSEVTFK